jgi:hypothetical protein
LLKQLEEESRGEKQRGIKTGKKPTQIQDHQDSRKKMKKS